MDYHSPILKPTLWKLNDVVRIHADNKTFRVELMLTEMHMEIEANRRKL